MVTSSLPGEGKSFTAINLAMSIAMELDRTVLLVDADVARPSLPGVLGLPEQKGLLDVLQDKSLKLGDVLLKTNVDKLTILTAGTRDTHATELLASEAMGRLLNEMARRYSDRVIIFDSPPLLVTTEARVLATRMGQIVFVVRAEETPQNAVKEALGAIEACPVKLMVLNQARNVENMAYGYEYGYGY
jgi:exopolysaccharide/PEP-CTERM locus tyrosine autokinase